MSDSRLNQSIWWVLKDIRELNQSMQRTLSLAEGLVSAERNFIWILTWKIQALIIATVFMWFHLGYFGNWFELIEFASVIS